MGNGADSMKILVTGAKGFVGKNLVWELRNQGFSEILEFDLDSDKSKLEEYTAACDFVFHLAGVNRPKEEKEYMDGNFGFTSYLLDLLEKNKNKAPLLITSSTQAKLDNPYGISKKAGEDVVFAYGKRNSVLTYVYRLPNLFGKWSRPDYNTVVATFCYNVARDKEIKINDPEKILTICYIDDVLEEFLRAIKNRPTMNESYCTVPVQHKITLGDLAATIKSFRKNRLDLQVPIMSDELTKKLYSTYLSFIPEDEFSYKLNMHRDERGSFTEMIRTPDRGQFSVNVSKPGVVKGNHWHHSKNEKFLVVSGEGVVRLRKIDDKEITEYMVSEENMQVVDIPPGYTHSIVNTGHKDMVAVVWANECFDPNNPDTYFLEVE